MMTDLKEYIVRSHQVHIWRDKDRGPGRARDWNAHCHDCEFHELTDTLEEADRAATEHINSTVQRSKW